MTIRFFVKFSFENNTKAKSDKDLIITAPLFVSM